MSDRRDRPRGRRGFLRGAQGWRRSRKTPAHPKPSYDLGASRLTSPGAIGEADLPLRRPAARATIGNPERSGPPVDSTDSVRPDPGDARRASPTPLLLRSSRYGEAETADGAGASHGDGRPRRRIRVRLRPRPRMRTRTRVWARTRPWRRVRARRRDGGARRFAGSPGGDRRHAPNVAIGLAGRWGRHRRLSSSPGEAGVPVASGARLPDACADQACEVSSSSGLAAST